MNNGAFEMRNDEQEKEQTIPAYWWAKANNFGDVIGPELLGYATGTRVQWCPADSSPKVLGVGSVLNRTMPGDVVWGAGAWDISTPCKPAPGASLLALRGRMSADKLGVHPAVLGDPVLLTPLLAEELNLEIPDPEYDVGFVANCQRPAKETPGHDFAVDITAPWRQVIQDLNRCKFVWTASLHALVCCEAFRIPVGYVEAPGIPKWKFQDYLTGTGRKPADIHHMRRLPPLDVDLQDRVQKDLLRVARQIPYKVSRGYAMTPEGSEVA